MSLPHDYRDSRRFFEDVPFHTLRQLAEFDRRKSLVAEGMMLELLGSTFRKIFGIPGTARTLAT